MKSKVNQFTNESILNTIPVALHFNINLIDI